MNYTYDLAKIAKRESETGKTPSEMKNPAKYESDTDSSIVLETSNTFDRWGNYHFHRHLELYYIISGEKVIFLGNKKYILKKDDVLIIESFVQHLVLPDNDSSRQYLIKLPDNYCSQYLSFMKGRKLKTPFLSSEKAIGLKKYFHTIVTEHNMMNPILLYANINMLLGEIISLCDVEENMINISNDRIELIVNYINKHYREKINLKTLADVFNYSPYYFSRLFNSLFNIGVPEYIAYVRLNNTIETFMTTDMFLTEIALANGFNSMQTFYRTFHKYYGDISVSDLKKVDAIKGSK
ncbi:MAG: helix-turn-helix transcriptional regulator [Clostridia bacterium]|nr:helix-turn-helix transcriptional regulator [Clostridia bacterium]